MATRFLPCIQQYGQQGGYDELLLVEGLSALQAVEQVRNKQTQAVLALQGKLPNAAKRSRQAIARHTQCQQLFNTLGCGNGSDCDVKKLQYDAVVMLSDPDIDGAHSRYLLLLLFQHYLQPVLQAQRLRLVVSPRYRLASASAGHEAPETRYFWSETQKQQFVLAQAEAGIFVTTVFKGLASLSPQELSRWVVAPDTRQELKLDLSVQQAQAPHAD